MSAEIVVELEELESSSSRCKRGALPLSYSPKILFVYLFKKWSFRQNLNPRPEIYKIPALPTELLKRKYLFFSIVKFSTVNSGSAFTTIKAVPRGTVDSLPVVCHLFTDATFSSIGSGHKVCLKLVLPPGLEPGTTRLKAGCSTN